MVNDHFMCANTKRVLSSVGELPIYNVSMMVAPGTLLGPYEIQIQVGAGGMGEVYRAKDTRLDRTVAIKILPQHLSNNATLKQRFDREARTISSLSHPHICSLYDIGHQDGIDYLVMEFVEGESLAQRLNKGPLNTELTLRYAIQIVEALDKAHKQGVIHRDLKPANIMVTKSGIKLLDFGLAKLEQHFNAQQVLSGVSALQTEQKDLTAEGTILGTVQYMSPEQLEGRDADARTDIFAFGAVLYEMATGKKAFNGKSQASLIAAILSSEPTPISTIQPMIPASLERVVQTCLAKDPDDRWQTAHDVMLELKWIAGGSQAAAVPPATRKRRHLREWMGWALAGLFLAAFAGLFLLRYWNGEQPEDLRVSIVSPEVGQTRFSLLSPDGRTLLLNSVDSGGRYHLWIRPLKSDSATRLAETENSCCPFWSPDSRSIGFFSNGKLKRMNLPNGRPEVICDAPQGEGASWGINGTILFTHQNSLFSVPASGGVAKRVTQLEPGQEGHRWPWFLPDGNHFLFLDDSNRTETHRLKIGSLDSSETHELLSPFISNVSYAKEHVFFVRGGTLMAQRLDQKTLRLTGSAIPIAEQLFGSGANHLYSFSVTEGGRISYQQINPNSQLTWFDRAGLQLENAGGPGRYASMDLSPDAKQVAIEILDADARDGEIWLLQSSRNTISRYTYDPHSDMAPQWSSDGTKIAFGSNRKGGGVDLYVKTAATTPEKLLFSPPMPAEAWPCGWAPDGSYLIYALIQNSNSDLWYWPISGDQKPHALFETPFFEYQAQVSPDGRWLAYVSNETGREEVYVQPMPPTGVKWQISNGGGWEPRWRGDGKEIFLIAADERLMAVEVRAEETFEAGILKPLFKLHERFMGPQRFNYDVSQDGQRFLINTLLDTTQTRPVHLIFNWKAENK